MFYRENDGTRIVVHGDDFLVLSDSQGLQEIDDLLRSAYELKRLGTLGFEEGDDREIHFLNRLIRVGKQTNRLIRVGKHNGRLGKHNGRQVVFLEPDRRHVDLLIRELGLETAKGVDILDVKKSVDQQMLESKNPILGKDLAKTYRSCVMRAAYLSQDRPDISHTVKDLARGMVNPTGSKWTDLKRLHEFKMMS